MITLTGANGLMTRLGKIIKWTRHLNGVRKNVAPSPSSAWGSGGATIQDADGAYGAIYDQFESSNSDAALVSGLPAQLDNFKNSLGNQFTTMQTLSQNVLISMANADTPLAQLTLQNAMTLLINQLTSQSNYCTGNTITATVSAGGSNVGTPKVIASVLDAHGKPLQYPFAENIAITVTSDSTRTATAGNEPLAANGTVANGDPMSQLWPQGSGISAASLSIIDHESDNSAGNILTNSGFETFVNTANLPDQWTRVTGTLGTQILKGTTYLDGAASIAFVGDSATLTCITQLFDNSTTGTAGVVTAPVPGPATSIIAEGVYAVNVWLYVSGTPAAGVFKVDLIDGSGTVINDDAGTPNSISQTLSALTATTWTNLNGFFRLPTTLPSSVSIRVHLTTALSTGTTLYIDNLAMGLPTQLYAGGPFVAAFRGATDVTINDTWTVAIANTLSTTGGIFTDWFERLFGMRSTLGLSLPVSGSGTAISDSLCQ